MNSDKPVENWVQNTSQFIVRIGATKFTLVFATAALMITLIATTLFRIIFFGTVEPSDFFVAVALTLLTAPLVGLFFSGLIKRLTLSHEHLKEAIEAMEKLRVQDNENNQRLQSEVEDKTNAQQQAQNHSRLLRSIIDASPDLIYFRNEEGKFAGCNKVAERMTGRTQEELMGLSPADVYNESLADKVSASDQVVLETNQPVTEETWLEFADGKKAFYELKKLPFYDSEDNRLGVLVFGRDLTEWKKAEDKLEKAGQDKISFISTISHELRTPLNGIVGLARMMADSDLNSEQAKWTKTIYTCAISLGNIFNDIIDLDKLERNRLELTSESINLPEFIDELESVTELLCAEKNLQFELEMTDKIPPYVMTDSTRLRQILWNLLSNAIKFTKQGKISLRLEPLSCDSVQSCIRFHVMDSGIGIPEAELKNIFAMYYQVTQDGYKSSVGTGIGLSVTHSLVDMMQGKIDVTSTEGVGSCFTVELPFSVPSMPVKPMLPKVSDLKLLLVEDIELNVVVAKALLEKLGHQVDVAMTGNEALEKVIRNEYDLILLDIQLPDISGFEVADKILHDDMAPGVPIVALTANVIKTRDEYLNNGMDEVIAKPIKKSRIIEVFNMFFAEDENPAELPKAELSPQQKNLNSILDMELLTTYLETIGKDMLTTSIQVFAKNIPDYLSELDVDLLANDKEAICSQAHKIKGAASSVGLSRVREIANQIQQGDHPAWWENLNDWVDDLKTACDKDFSTLETWISEQADDEQV